jgi:hypothetical protein
MYAKAEQTYGMALTVATRFNNVLADSGVSAIQGPAQLMPAQIASFPNLQTLFGPDSFCSCDECQSVLGAGAYLADLLEFLRHRTASGTTSLRDVLLQRRPDIALILLNCDNTNTELPYIDLVNELLEDAVAPPADPNAAARTRQTTLTTQELDANPQFVNAAAYTTLAGAVYPWNLPFDLPLAEARTYLGQMGLDRVKLIRAFQKSAGYPSAQARQIAVEMLGLSAIEADIITGGALAAGNQSWQYWGLSQNGNSVADPYDPTQTVTGGWIAVLTQARVLLTRANLQYQELARLLNTRFINDGGALTIVCTPPDSCDVSTMTVTGLTQDALDRIHRFVRLWRHLNWNVYDLDDAIGILQNAAAPGLPRLNDQLLRQLAVVAQLAAKDAIPVRQAVALFVTTPTFASIPTRDIPTLPGDDVQNSLYTDLFQNVTVLNPVDPVFALNADGTEIAAIGTNPELADHQATLVAALQVAVSDLNLAITTFTDGKLTLANLSTIYRNVQLSSMLGITMTELISLLAIAEAGTDTAPFFERIQPFEGTRPESLPVFAAALDTIRASNLTIEQLDFMLRDVFTSGSGVAPDPVAVGTLLVTLYNGLQKIATQNAFTPDPTGSTTRKELAKLLSATDIATITGICDGSTTLNASDATTAVGTILGPYMDATDAQAKLTSGGALDAGQARFEYVLVNILAYERRTLGTGLIVQTFAQALSVPVATSALLLESWFLSTTTPGVFAIADYLALASLPLADTSDPVTPATPGFAPYFAGYTALANAALLISSLGLTTADSTWWQTSGVAAGWLDPTKLPAAPAATANGGFARWSRIVTATNVRAKIAPGNLSFAALFGFAGGGATKAQVLTLIEALTQWPADSLAILCGTPGNPADQGLLSLQPSDYQSERALARLIAPFLMISQYGFPSDVSTWIAPSVTAPVADAIKQGVKANYPLSQWFPLAKQLRDPLRMQQRDALVGYLLANPPGVEGRWLDSDDVFARYLIDVEMCSCMATSRIVQANSAIQLFVQRCLLDIEPAVTVDQTDTSWAQWEWMSQYRVWEANREVFLFPENWIDPTLRKSATTFFADLQTDLKQNNLTNDVAETGLSNYLEKLEAVARLDVVGTFHDTTNGGDTLHVVARTQGSPPIYYQRHWNNSATWDGWLKIDLDIASDHVLPVVWNGKPYLFWAIVSVKPDQNSQPYPAAAASSSAPPLPNVHLDVQLAWSQYKQSKWQAKQTAPQSLVFQGLSDPQSITLRSAFNGHMLNIDIYVDNGSHGRKHAAQFQLGGAGTGVEALIRQTNGLSAVGTTAASIGPLAGALIKPDLTPPSNSLFDGDWLAPDPAGENYLSSSRGRVGPLTTTFARYNTLPSEVVLQQADYFRLVVPHQLPSFDSSLPFFYRDAQREYFCIPTTYYQNGNYFTINAPSYIYHPNLRAEYEFAPFYHAFVWLFYAQLNITGLDALYSRTLQLHPEQVAGTAAFDFKGYYEPTVVLPPYSDGTYPTEGVDFESDAGYALYNWELFYHAPFLIANQLSTNQQFADAKTWYEYIFNPSAQNSDTVPRRYWITKPFYNMTDYNAEQINALMLALNGHDPLLEKEVAAWRADPFDPDMIAQLRPVAYQRAIVTAYINNLIAWGDNLFTQDTLETINQATQLYVLAASLLGPRPQVVPPRVQPADKTYADLEGSFDDFSDALVAAENVIPPVRVNVPTPPGAQSMPVIETLYFRVPSNSRLLTAWDTVADRLYKIRNCMNIQGVVQQLGLFAPAINPGALVAAAAAGLDLGSALSDLNAATPPYRFSVMIREATELANEVQELGSSLLQALEKRDAEQLATIRSSGEIKVQKAVDDFRNRQIDEANAQITALSAAKNAYNDRLNFYKGRAFMNPWEATALIAHGASLIPQAIGIALETTATVAHAVPAAQFGGSGFGGTPHVSAVYGGQNVGHASNSGAKAARIAAAILQTTGLVSGTLGSYYQRQDEWNLQATLATDDLGRLNAEIATATIRADVATKQKAAQDITVQNANDVDANLRSKFTNQELYDWMVGSISTTYFQAYQLAYSVAKEAEQCYRRELAIPDSSFVQFGYWDSLRQGLTAGEQLRYDLRRLESAYYTKNARELELTKHISLAQLDPYALVQLRNTGTCLIELPELLFDLDNPGHYLRRLKSVAVTVPCVVGPYGGVSLTLNLLDNHIRTTTDTGAGYARTAGTDLRFIDDPGGTNEIVTSSGQNDSGMFDVQLTDERYLPFESSGAISTWRATLNNVYPQFDYRTITDLVLHVRYTARDGGQPLAQTVGAAVKLQLNSLALAQSRKGLYRMFSARHDYGSNWSRFLNPGAGNDQVLTLDMGTERFPFFTSGMDIKIGGIDVLANTADSSDFTLVITPPGGVTNSVTFRADATLNGVHHWSNTALAPKIDLGRTPTPPGGTPPTWTIKMKKNSAADFRSLTAVDLDDLVLIVAYQVS